MKSISIKITGTKPIMMNYYHGNEIKAVEKMPIEDQLKLCEYRLAPEEGEEKGKLYVPSENVRKSIGHGAKYVAGKRGVSLRPTVLSMITIEPAALYIYDDEDNYVYDYEIDERSVRNNVTNGRRMKKRPLITEWNLKFTLQFDPTLLSAKQMRECVDRAGLMSGILEFRKERGGPFGEYIVNDWKVLK